MILAVVVYLFIQSHVVVKSVMVRKNRAGKKYPESRCRRLDGMLLFF